MNTLKYLKIKEHLEAVALRPESSLKMPSVRELMKQFNVSLTTVNKALALLEGEGVIVRRQGSGIMAARPSRVTTSMQNAGKNKGEIILAHVDYPSEPMYERLTYITNYIEQLGFAVCSYKTYINTTTETLTGFIRNHPDCRGVVLVAGSDRLDAERLDALGQLGMPVALFDSMFFYDPMPATVRTFSPDPVDCAWKTVEMLAQCGHKRLGLVRNEPYVEYTKRFLKGMADACRRFDIPFGPDYIFSAAIRSWDNSLDAAVEQTRAHLDDIRRLGLTALMYKSSAGALAALKILTQEAGLRVPEDISVTGEGDMRLYDYLVPGLTTVSTDYETMIRAAVDHAAGRESPARPHSVYPHHVTARESVRDFRRAAPSSLEPSGERHEKPEPLHVG